MNGCKYSIVVPCFNEEGNIQRLFQEFGPLIEQYKNLELVLVDNGSTDHTRSQLLQYKSINNQQIKMIFLNSNVGYGGGILAGLQEADGLYVGWTHADLQFSPLEFVPMINFVEQYQGDGIIFLKGLRKKRPISDNVFTILMSIFESILFLRPMWDINGQPTLVSRKFYLKYASVAPSDFSLDLFFYNKATVENATIKRWPVAQRDRCIGKSSWNTGLLSRLKLICRIIAYSVKLRLIDK